MWIRSHIPQLLTSLNRSSFIEIHLGLRKIVVPKKNFSPKKVFDRKRVLGPKNFGFKTILVHKTFGLKKNQGTIKLWAQTIFGSENIGKITGPQKFWVKKNLG